MKGPLIPRVKSTLHITVYKVCPYLSLILQHSALCSHSAQRHRPFVIFFHISSHSLISGLCNCSLYLEYSSLQFFTRQLLLTLRSLLKSQPKGEVTSLFYLKQSPLPSLFYNAASNLFQFTSKEREAAIFSFSSSLLIRMVIQWQEQQLNKYLFLNYQLNWWVNSFTINMHNLSTPLLHNMV